jgi:hypothetical protein
VNEGQAADAYPALIGPHASLRWSLPAQQKAPRSKGRAVFCASKKHSYPGDAGRFSAPIQDVGARSSWSSRSGGLGAACGDAGPVDTGSPEGEILVPGGGVSRVRFRGKRGSTPSPGPSLDAPAHSWTWMDTAVSA